MASRYSVPLQPPTQFRFDSPDEWPRWKRRFEQFRVASGLSEEGEERQVSTLLYCLGEEAEDVLTSTNITNDDRKKYDAVVGKFDEFFKVRKNVIYERARFNRRSQHEEETAEQYITALYSLAEDCDFGNTKEMMIRDRLVVGIRDATLSERLQTEADLDLEKAKRFIRQREAVREQQSKLRNTSEDQPTVQAVTGNRQTRGKWQQKPKRPTQAPKQYQQKVTRASSQCTRCGKSHAHKPCPAREAPCHKCGKKGHYARVCRTKSVAAVDDDPLEMAYLNSVDHPISTPSASWSVQVKLKGISIPFKLDTGAEVTAVSEDVLQTIGRPTLRKPSKRLCGPDRKPLEVLGSFMADLSCKQQSCQQEIFVVRRLRNNLLGLPAITALQLLAQVEMIQDAASSIRKKFPQLFQGLGTIAGEYEIRLKSDALPYALSTARKVPIPLREKVREELERMEKMGVISKVDSPTDWCAGMVVVPKKNGSIRICVDLKPLNKSVLRENHPLPCVDETLAQLSGASIFSKLDANSGFWQIPLSSSSRHLTTFITPFGRYCFNKLPFGISSAPELFQKRMSAILSGLNGVLCLIDDVLIFGKDQKEHDERLNAALEKIQRAGVTLNEEKCMFSQKQVTFLGHLIDQNGISADPQKTAAITEMDPPTNITEMRRFMGMVNQLGKFSPQIASLSKPLRELLSTKRSWLWGPDQEAAFVKVKEEMATPRVLALYDPKAATKISADASSYGLGAVLLQQTAQGTASEWRPVAYASRSLTTAETRYAQIEKEALALTWACEKFSPYILGLTISLETDHKPLVPLLSHTHLDCLPPRVLRFRLRLMRFSYEISHVPGKLLYAADALSRCPQKQPLDVKTITLDETVETYIAAVIKQLPASEDRLQAYCTAQQQDPMCAQVIEFCKRGWPAKQRVQSELKPYWEVRGGFTLYHDLLLQGNRIVIPKKLQMETLMKLHQGHQGIQRCRLRAATSVWWPGISHDVEKYVRQCPQCSKSLIPAREPMMPSPLPSHPWEKVGADLFELQGHNYLVVVDYFSRYPEVQKLTSTTSKGIIIVLKSIFSRHGIPSVFMSDNGPQFVSKEMQEFAATYSFQQVTSSPRYPQSNGLAERTVKTLKDLLRHSPDPNMALLSYRTTALPWCSLSPAELLMGRKLRTDVPQLPSKFIPEWHYLHTFREKDASYKQKQKINYDGSHRTRSRDTFDAGTAVWIRMEDTSIPGRVISMANTPRSYLVSTPSGVLRRNRYHLTARPDHPDAEDATPLPANISAQSPRDSVSSRSQIMTRSRTGTEIKAPERLRF